MNSSTSSRTTSTGSPIRTIKDSDGRSMVERRQAANHDADQTGCKLWLHRGSYARTRRHGWGAPTDLEFHRGGLALHRDGGAGRPGHCSRPKSGRQCGTASSPERAASSTSIIASTGPIRPTTVLRDPPYAAVRAVVRSTNQLITQLAPVLNAPFADGFATADPSVRTMTKFHQDKYFVFAGSKENRASTPTISLTGFDSGTATVIGENRTIPISNGRFSDSFRRRQCDPYLQGLLIVSSDWRDDECRDMPERAMAMRDHAQLRTRLRAVRGPEPVGACLFPGFSPPPHHRACIGPEAVRSTRRSTDAHSLRK